MSPKKALLAGVVTIEDRRDCKRELSSLLHYSRPIVSKPGRYDKKVLKYPYGLLVHPGIYKSVRVSLKEMNNCWVANRV